MQDVIGDENENRLHGTLPINYHNMYGYCGHNKCDSSFQELTKGE